MSVRRLEPRNLCESRNDEDTCLVTVSDAEFGTALVQTTLSAEDDAGEHSVGPGSLVRVVGTVMDAASPTDGAPMVKASYLRHWPRHYFATKSAARQLRQ